MRNALMSEHLTARNGSCTSLKTMSLEGGLADKVFTPYCFGKVHYFTLTVRGGRIDIEKEPKSLLPIPSTLQYCTTYETMKI